MREFDRKQADKILKHLDDTSGLFPQFAFVTEGEELKLIGKGGFSSVYEMYNRERPELKYALKVTGLGNRYADPESFRNTSRLWWLLGRESDYIVRVIETGERHVTLEEGDELDLQLVLTEELSGIIEKDRFGNACLSNKKPASEEEVIEFAGHIGRALLKSHNENVLHRDVKLENIFWDEANGVYKLGDFGIAKYALEGVAETICYTDGYGAPEIEKRLYENYDDTADIYSFGITLYLLLNDLKFPASDGYYPNVRSQYDPEFVFPAPAHASAEMTAIIRKMCSFEPGDRYASMEEVMDAVAGLTGESGAEAESDYSESGAETETYREEGSDSESESKVSGSNRRKSRRSIRAEEESFNSLLSNIAGFHMITLLIMLPLLFKGSVISGNHSADILLWFATGAVLFQAIFQKIGDLEIVFGGFALFLVGLSAYNSGFTCIHLVFVLCILSRISAFSFAAGISAVIWIIMSVSGKPAFLDILTAKDISWFLLGLFFAKYFSYMYFKLYFDGESYFRLRVHLCIMAIFSVLGIIAGICIQISEEIQRMHLVRNILIFMPVSFAIIRLENKFLLSEEDDE